MRGRDVSKAAAAALLAGALAAGGVTAPEAHASAAGEPDPESAASAADGAAYLAGTQGDDGSVPEGWRVDYVGEAVAALVAGGGQRAAVDDALGYLEEAAPRYVEDDEDLAVGEDDDQERATNGGQVGRIVSGLVAAGEDPRNFAGVDFVAEIESYHEPTGSYGGNLYGDALAMVGLLAAGAELPDDAVDRLRVNQCSNGGWSWQSACGRSPDTDTTALAASVLAAVAGPNDEDVVGARQWLLDVQNDSGCWGLEADDVDNANSCGLALSTVVALGEDPGSPPWTEEDRRPLEALRDLQIDSGPDGGAFRHKADASYGKEYATVQAVPGMAHRAYPVRAPGASEEDPDSDTGDGDSGDGDSGDGDSGESDSGSSSTDSGDTGDGDGNDTGSTASTGSTSSSSTSSTTAATRLEAAAGLSSSSSSTTTTTGSTVDDTEVGVTTTTRPALGWTALGDSGGFDEAGDRPARRAAGRSFTANLDGSGGTSEIPTVAAGAAGVMLVSGVLGTGWWWRRRRLAGIEIAGVSETAEVSGPEGD